MNDERIGCLLVGPGMGDIPQVLTLALTSKAPKVLDADAITHLGESSGCGGRTRSSRHTRANFGACSAKIEGSKAERALEAARLSGAVVVYKGPDTLVASPDGRLGFAPPAPAWLATAGTGDVLAGMIAALRAQGLAGIRGRVRGRLAARPSSRDRRAGDDRGRSRRGNPTGARARAMNELSSALRRAATA